MADVYVPRLRKLYDDEIRAKLIEQFSYTNPMQVPKLDKIVLNMGVGDAVGDSKLIIHNAAFDIKFLNAELKRMNLPTIPWEQALDTLAIARKKFPGSPASLDALCRRFGISNEARTMHGALLDSLRVIFSNFDLKSHKTNRRLVR